MLPWMEQNLNAKEIPKQCKYWRGWQKGKVQPLRRLNWKRVIPLVPSQYSAREQ
jgi:hypothetical protein